MYLYTRRQCEAGFLLLYRYYFCFILESFLALLLVVIFLYLNVNVPVGNIVYYLTLPL